MQQHASVSISPSASSPERLCYTRILSGGWTQPQVLPANPGSSPASPVDLAHYSLTHPGDYHVYRLSEPLPAGIVDDWRADDKTATTFPRIKDIRMTIGFPYAGLGERQFRRLAREALQDIGLPHTSLDDWIHALPPER